MKIEHGAVATHSVEESDEFFISLLGFEKTREFVVDAELIEAFFGVKGKRQFLRYERNGMAFEVIVDEGGGASDDFTHLCLMVDDKKSLSERAVGLGFEVIKKQRNDGSDFYLFIKDKFGNLYEIKEK